MRVENATNQLTSGNLAVVAFSTLDKVVVQSALCLVRGRDPYVCIPASCYLVVRSWSPLWGAEAFHLAAGRGTYRGAGGSCLRWTHPRLVSSQSSDSSDESAPQECVIVGMESMEKRWTWKKVGIATLARCLIGTLFTIITSSFWHKPKSTKGMRWGWCRRHTTR